MYLFMVLVSIYCCSLGTALFKPLVSIKQILQNPWHRLPAPKLCPGHLDTAKDWVLPFHRQRPSVLK